MRGKAQERGSRSERRPRWGGPRQRPAEELSRNVSGQQRPADKAAGRPLKSRDTSLMSMEGGVE